MSPSNTTGLMPSSPSRCASDVATVDFPADDSPVIQITQPLMRRPTGVDDWPSLQVQVASCDDYAYASVYAPGTWMYRSRRSNTA